MAGNTNEGSGSIASGKAVDRLKGGLPPSQRNREKELDAKDAEVEDFIIDGKKFGTELKKLELNIRDAVTDARLTLTIEGASTVEIDFADDDRVLLKSGLFNFAVDLTVGGKHFRLVKVLKTGNLLKCTFEDTIVAYLRQHDKFKKVSRGKYTRAEFILLLIREVKKVKIKTFIPELHVKQPVKRKTEKKSDTQRHKERAPGLSGSGFTVKGEDATPTQVKNAERVLDVGYEMGAAEVVMVSAIETIIVESEMYNLQGGDRDSVGLFQQRPSQGWTTIPGPGGGRTKIKVRSIETDATQYFERAIALHKQSPLLHAGEIAWRVQQPRADLRGEYQKWWSEATEYVNDYTGEPGGPQSGETRTIRKKFEFTRGEPDKKEDSWDAIQRLVKDVQWRAFVMGNDTVAVVSETYLFKSNPWLTFNEDQEEVESIDFDFDSGKDVAEATIIANAQRWFVPTGATAAISQGYGPATGKWLVTQIERSYFRPSTTVTLKKPMKQLKEPDTTTQSVASEEGHPHLAGTVIKGGSVRDRIVKAAEYSAKHKNLFIYDQIRPFPPSLFLERPPCVTDCSGFVTLCYKAARAEDPNGSGYNGQGYTGTLWTNGSPTKKPKPGDLVFYGSPASPGGAAHVAVYLGENDSIGFGSSSGPRHAPANYRNIAGYRTYLND